MKKLRRRVEKFNGLCVGLDLHKTFIQMSVLDRHGDEVEADRFASDRGLLGGWLDRLAERGEAMLVVIEASGCFVWVYDLLVERLGREAVKVAAPSKVKVIAEAGEKTDASDAWWLAYLAHEGRLPEAPPETWPRATCGSCGSPLPGAGVTERDRRAVGPDASDEEPPEPVGPDVRHQRVGQRPRKGEDRAAGAWGGSGAW